MKILLIISIICFYISFWSNQKYRKKYESENDIPLIATSVLGVLIINVLTILAATLPIISYIFILDIKWYWCILINYAVLPLSDFLSSIYCELFGYKTKPMLSLKEGGYVRHNILIVDAFITLAIGGNYPNNWLNNMTL